MSALKLFLFDLDGTLLDTAPTLAAAANRVLADRGLEPLPVSELRPYVSKGAPGLLGRGLGITPEDKDFPSLRRDFLSYYAEDIITGTGLFDGVREMIDALHSRGIRTGIVTNKPEYLTLQLLDALDATPLFSVIMGSDSVGGAMKPNPQSLLTALERTGVRAQEALYAGDDRRDIEAAHRAGMPAASVAWGYSNEDMSTWSADFHARTPSDLVRWVDKFQ